MTHKHLLKQQLESWCKIRHTVESTISVLLNVCGFN